MDFSFLHLIFKGAGVTILLAFVSLLIGLILSIIWLGLIKIKNRFIVWPTEFILLILRGLPELVIIMIIFYGIPQILLILLDDPININPFVAGTASLSIIFSAYAVQVLRASIESIPSGQWLAGKALGLNSFQIFFAIILPQMYRLSIPGLSNLWLVLLKDTSLVALVGISDIMHFTQAIISVTAQPFTWYVVAASLYLTFTLISSYLLNIVNKYANRYV